MSHLEAGVLGVSSQWWHEYGRSHLHDVRDGLEEARHLSVERLDLRKLDQTQSCAQPYLRLGIAPSRQLEEQKGKGQLTLPQSSR